MELANWNLFMGKEYDVIIMGSKLNFNNTIIVPPIILHWTLYNLI